MSLLVRLHFPYLHYIHEHRVEIVGHYYYIIKLHINKKRYFAYKYHSGASENVS